MSPYHSPILLKKGFSAIENNDSIECNQQTIYFSYFEIKIHDRGLLISSSSLPEKE